MATFSASIKINAVSNLTKVAKRISKSTEKMRKGFKKLSAGLKKVSAAFAKFARRAALAFAGVTAAITALIVKTAAFGDNLDKTAQKTGVAVEQLQRLRLAARIGGGSTADMDKGIRFLSRSISEAADGMLEYQEAFESMGVSVVDSTGKLRKTEDVLFDIADFFSVVEDGAAKTTDAMAVFGRAGTNLIPMLNSGAKGIKEIGDKLLDLTTDEEADEAADFVDQLELMRTNIMALTRRALIPAIPILSSWFAVINDNLPTAQKWLAENVDIAAVLERIKDAAGKIDLNELFDVSLEKIRAVMEDLQFILAEIRSGIEFVKSVREAPSDIAEGVKFLTGGETAAGSLFKFDQPEPQKVELMIHAQAPVEVIKTSEKTDVFIFPELGVITP